MATRTSVTFKFTRGVTFERTFNYKNPDQTPIDITGLTVSFGFRRRDEKEAAFAMTSGAAATANGSTIEITDAAAGEIELKLTDEETDAIDFDLGNWWLHLLVSGDVRPMAKGELEIMNR